MTGEKKKSKLSTWLCRLFVNPGAELSDMEGERIVSPGKQMLSSFLHNKIAMIGVTVFLLTLILVLVGPYFYPIDLSYTDVTQMNIAPGLDMMAVPQNIAGDLKEIEPGGSFGFGLTYDGKIHAWGKTKITNTIDLKNIPDEVREANIEHIAVGSDHVVVTDADGSVFAWGNDRLSQLDIPRKAKDLAVKQLDAGMQYSAIVEENGELILWGNENATDCKVKKAFQGQIAQVACADTAYIALLTDGSVAYTGYNTNHVLASVPAGLESDVIQVAATSTTAAALKADGTVVVWGNAAKGENLVPQTDSRIVSLKGGRYHYTAQMEDGSIVCWGDNTHKQTNVPANIAAGADVKYIASNYYQNYAITTNNKVVTWGLKGYLFGTDDLGRDVLTRMINGGRITMTVGAVSVIISLFIGVFLGCFAGYFGGTVDMVVMRLAEVVNSLPFLPLAMILSSVLGSRVSQEGKMYLIMVIQGLLYWTTSCRLVRAQVLQARENEYVVAARAMGETRTGIMFKQILPNILSQLLVTATLSFASCMLTESSLSYLGFGVVAPTPTWGNMLKGANNSIVIQQYWWRWVFPASIFGLCTICINLVGDGLRDAVDPKALER